MYNLSRLPIVQFWPICIGIFALTLLINVALLANKDAETIIASDVVCKIHDVHVSGGRISMPLDCNGIKSHIPTETTILELLMTQPTVQHVKCDVLYASYNVSNCKAITE
jgi:hypothetical protein